MFVAAAVAVLVLLAAVVAVLVPLAAASVAAMQRMNSTCARCSGKET
jgi:hypothetical protein